MAYQSDSDRREINRRTEQYEQEAKERNNGVGTYETSRSKAEREFKWNKPLYRRILRERGR